MTDTNETIEDRQEEIAESMQQYGAEQITVLEGMQAVRKRHPKAVFAIDASRDRAAAAAYGVMGVLFIVFIAGGKIERAAAGVQREAVIEDFLAAESKREG